MLKTLTHLFQVILISLFCASLFASNRSFNLSVLSESQIENIYKIFPTLKSNNFSKADIDALIKHLVNQEQFENVRVESQMQDGTEVFTVSVGKTRRISKLSFTGHNFLSESDIRKEVNIPEKSNFDQQLLIDAGERLRRNYRDHGFHHSIVDLEFKKQSQTDIEVSFNIKEGPQTIIKKAVVKSANEKFVQQFETKVFKFLKNEPLNDSIINQLKKEFREAFSSKGYWKADLAGPDVILNSDESEAALSFTVNNPEHFTLSFDGTKEISPRALTDDLDLNNFYSTNPNLGPELATKVKLNYLNRGYARVTVTAEEVATATAFEKTVAFEIKEGPKVKIKEIRISGSLSMDESNYVDFIKKHSTDLISDSFYNREDLQIGLNNLVIDRQNNGYLRAKILSTKTTYSGDDRQFVSININFDEGPLTMLNSISFEGNRQIGNQSLLEVLELSPNQPLKLNELEEGIVALKSYYQSIGFLEMSLINEKEDLVQYNSDSTEATVQFKIYEGPKIMVASILIEGNTLTKDYVLMNELDFQIGDVLTPDNIEETIRRLQRLGHFNSVEVKTLEEKTQIAERTVIIKVSDRDPGLFTVGAGVTSELGFTGRGYTGVAYRNIGGTGRGASVRLEGNYNFDYIRYLESKATFGYLEPYLFDTRAKGRFNYTFNEYVSDFKTGEITQIKQLAYSLEQDFTSHFFVSYDLFNSAQVRTYRNPNEEKNQELVIITTGPTLTWDYRDHPFNPTAGTFTRLSYEYATPNLGGSYSIHYGKAFASITKYNSYRPGWVWANSVRGGHIQNFCRVNENEKCGVPYNLKGLMLGGQSSIRGFLPDEAFPNRDDLLDNNGKPVTTSDFVMTGHADMFMLKSEIRFPISGNIGGAVFYDGGAVWVSGQDIYDPYRDAVGIGIRYATPIGSVSIDIGYKLDQYSARNESQFPFYFSIGTF